MKRRSHILLSVGAFALLGGALWADDQQLALRVWTFRLPGTELGLDLCDMDGDGRQDLVIAHMQGPRGDARSISLFVQGERRQRFQAKPNKVWQVPRDACAFVAGDFDPAPGGEVALLCPRRIVLLRSQGGPHVIAMEGFFDYPEQGGLPVWDLAWDLNGNGRPELVVPTKKGYSVYSRAGAARLLETSKLRIPIDQRFGPAFETTILNRFLTSSLRLRRLVSTDINGDGRLDLVAYLKQGLARFLQRPNGTFPEKPDQAEPLEIVSKKGKDRAKEQKEKDTEAFANVRLALVDLNRDKQAELVATETLGKVGVFETLRTRLVIFRGRRGEKRTWDESSPDTVINLKGVSGNPVFVDWDGDKRQDLVVSAYRMDMFTNVKRALLKTMSIEYMVFRQRAKGKLFPREPDLSLSVDVPIEEMQRRGGHKAVLLRADLNGDGLHDMVARRSDGGLKVVLGKRIKAFFGGTKLGFDEKRPIKLSVGRTEPPRVADLDGDGKDELILEPFGGDDARARVVRVVGVAR